jgi:hypothetical protein
MDEFQFRLSPKRGNGYLTFSLLRLVSSSAVQLATVKKKRNICEHENPKIQKFTRPRKNEIK